MLRSLAVGKSNTPKIRTTLMMIERSGTMKQASSTNMTQSKGYKTRNDVVTSLTGNDITDITTERGKHTHTHTSEYILFTLLV